MSSIDHPHGSRWRMSSGPWHRPIVVAVIADIVMIAINGMWLADYLRDEGPPFPPDAGTLIWIQLVAIALGLVVATPAFAGISHQTRRAGIPLGAGVLAVLVGVLGFLVAAQVNDAIIVSLGLIPGGGPNDAFDPISIIVAPAVEEPTKLLAVAMVALLLRPAFGVRAGIVLGLLVGIGATLVEAGASLQIQYAAGGGPIYGTILAIRFGLFGLGLHATTAAMTGAGLGLAFSVWPARRGLGIIGLALAGALLVHVLWNLWASRLTFELVAALAGEPALGADEPYAHWVLMLGSSVVTAVLLAPAALALWVAWRRSGPDRGRVTEASSTRASVG